MEPELIQKLQTVSVSENLPKLIEWAKIPEAKRNILAKPSEFCRNIGMELYDHQAAVMDAMALHRSRVTVKTCNESGKTTRILTGLILWHATFGHSISTSGSWAQVINQLVPSLKRYAGRFPASWSFNATSIDSPQGKKWIGFSVKDEGRAEGYHGILDKDPIKDYPLMALFDEAKSVPRGVFEAVEGRCNPQRLIMASSPGYAEGEFYDSFVKNKELYQTFSVDYTKCPHIDPESVARRIKKHGIDHPLVRSMIFAEFMNFVEGALLSLADIEACMEYPPKQLPGDRRVFCDFAAGGDENVIAFRMGNRVTLEDAWHDKNTMSAVGRFITVFKRLQNQWGLRPDEIDGDADGLGKPMVDAIREAGWPINEFRGGGPAHQDTYFNRITEVWHEGCKRVQRRDIILPNDEDFRCQAINRKSKFHSKGKQWIESKEDMKDPERNAPSPDRADAIFGAMVDQPFAKSINITEVGRGPNKRFHHDWDEGLSISEDVLLGIDAG